MIQSLFILLKTATPNAAQSSINLEAALEQLILLGVNAGKHLLAAT